MWKLILLIIILFIGSIVFHSSNMAITLTSDVQNVSTDTVYMFFLPNSRRYEKRKRGLFKIEDRKVRTYEYTIKMNNGLDLCFGNDFSEKEELAYQTTSFKELQNIDIKAYDWLTENYQDKDFKVLCNEKMKTKTTEFYLVVPDSITRTAEILHVFNCNYTYD